MTSPFLAVRTGAPVARLPVAAPRRPAVGVRIRPRSDLKAIPLSARTTPRRKDDEGGRSLLGQFKDAFTGIPQGVYHLGRSAAISAAAPVRAAIDFKNGELDGREALWRGLPGSGGADSLLGFLGNDAAAERAAEYNPLGSEFAESMKNTIGNVRHPTRYGRAWDEGRIVGTVLEDVGNVALLGGAASKALGTASGAAATAGNAARADTLARWGGRAERVSTLGNQLSDAPVNAGVSLARRGIGAGRGLTIAGYDAAKAGRFGGVLQGAAEVVHARAPMLTTEVGRYVRGARRQVFADGVRAEGGVVKKIRAAEEAGSITPAEQGAVSAVRNGAAAQLKYLMDSEGLSIEDARQQLVLKDIPEQTFTADIAQASLDYLNRTLAGDDLARLDRYAGVIDEVLGANTDRALAGVGRPGGPLDPAQLGDDVNWESVDAALRAEGEVGLGALDPNGNWIPYTKVRSEVARDPSLASVYPDLADVDGFFPPGIDDLKRAILDNPMSWPAPWRPSMVLAKQAHYAPLRELDNEIRTTRGDLNAARADLNDARAAVKAEEKALGKKLPKAHPLRQAAEAAAAAAAGPRALLAKLQADRPVLSAKLASDPPRVPLRPTQQLAAGMERPGYQPGGRSDITNPRSEGTGRVPIREGIRGIGDIRSSHTRLASEFQPYSGRTVAERAGQEARATVVNEGTQRLFSDDRVPTVADIIPQRRRTELMNEAETIAEQTVGRAGPVEFSKATREAYGQLVMAELKDVHQFDVLPGNRDNPKVGDLNPDAKVVYNEITDQSIALPAGLKDRLIPYMRGKDMGRFMNGLAKINSKFKGVVLPFSVRWQLGDAVGGAFMSWVGGGVPPWELVSSMQKIGDVSEAGREAVFAHKDFQDSGLNLEDSRWMRQNGGAEPPTTRLGKAWHRAGDVRRKSFKVNESINRVNRQGYVLAKLQRLLEEKGLNLDDVDGAGAWDDPTVVKAVQDAVDDANEVMGTFDQMSPFERNYVRNIFPFWAWNRHITQLAWRTAIDNPARMMWTMRLGSYGASKEDADLLPWQVGSIAIGDKLIPTNFINPLNDVAGGSIYTPTGALRSMSPGIKMIAATFGKDFNRGAADITRPFDGKGLDELGRAGGIRMNLPIPGMGASAFAYNVLRQFPQTRELMNVLPTGQVGRLGLGPHPRYGTGELMIDNRGRPIDTDSRIQSLYGLIGLRGAGDTPLLGSSSDNEEIIATRDRRRAEAAKRASNTRRFGDD